MSEPIPINGSVDDQFSRVRRVFERNFEEGLELGAGFCAFVDGVCVVDLIGGHTDRAKQTPWTEVTIACIYSSGKAITTLLIAQVVSDGVLHYDEPVARYWPAFAANGKDQITVAEALSHQAGVCGLPDEMPSNDWFNWDLICARIAEMAPLWPPGSASGYHPQTAGFIAGELLRRVTGRSFGQILSEDFAAPDELSIFCGVSGAVAERAAFMPKPPKAPDLGVLNEYKRLAFLKPWSAPARVASGEWMAAQLPASNIHADARAVAQIVHPLARSGVSTTGNQILTPDAISQALATRISGDDLVLPFHLTWTAGLMANTLGHFGPSKTAFGHAGFGGSAVVIDPAKKITAAYVMNKMSPYLVGDPRAMGLISALYEAL